MTHVIGAPPSAETTRCATGVRHRQRGAALAESCSNPIRPAPRGKGATAAKEEAMNDLPVLISWISTNRDPFHREWGRGEYVVKDGRQIPGPTLTLLLDEDSPYARRVSHVVLFHRDLPGSEGEKDRLAVRETIGVLGSRLPDLQIQPERWRGKDPTNLMALFPFMRERMRAVRSRFLGRELIIHISPGTPAMQTIWVLMGETGMIEPPFKLVKSYRPGERPDGRAVVEVNLDLETFFKCYRRSALPQPKAPEQSLLWDPRRFRTRRMAALFEQARRFAHINVPILITGERGTGKTALAAWIRVHSPYRKPEQDGAWPAVACGQYTPETMRAELFGYRKGAFTDATQDRTGLLDRAHGDTLFLDEIGDISCDLQRLLIKALEEKRFFPLGDDRPHKSNFRLITATNLDAHTLRKRLDPDFLDRISLFTLHIPPLREIPEELPWLWEQTYQVAAIRADITPSKAQLPPECHRRIIRALQDSPLHGNIRDLHRLAYHILAATQEPLAPLPPEDAVSLALQALDRAPLYSAEDEDLARAVARSFADNRPIDHLVSPARPLPTKPIRQHLEAYLARELRSIALKHGISVGEICDVTERTIRAWLRRPGMSGKKILQARK
jgi:DNA-binding NtrC family response regulator